MIRKLIEEDRKQVLQYLYRDVSYNIFIIGDIENFGFDQDFQTVYGELDESGNYKSVLLFYNENAIYYSHNNYFNKKYTKILEQHKFHYMNGKEELMTLIKPFLPSSFKFQPMYFCNATEIHNPSEVTETIKQIQTEEDISRLYDLLVTIEEFGIQHRSRESFIDSSKKGLVMGTKLYIEKDGKIVSTVATTADTTKNAMIVGVATHKDFRGKGYASQLMISLMQEYLKNKKKDLCLFYDNPEAGKIYKRLGFKDVGKWVMMSDIEG